MDGRKKPQPPPPVGSPSKSAPKQRSRSSTPTVSAVPTAVGASTNSSGRFQSTKTTSNNITSPRAGSSSSVNKPTHEEPATDDDESRASELPRNEWFSQSEETLAVLDKQVSDAAKKNAMHRKRCNLMRDFIAGKGDSMEVLQGTYATLTRAVVELESFSSNELDSEMLEEMFLSIPDEHRSSLGQAE